MKIELEFEPYEFKKVLQEVYWFAIALQSSTVEKGDEESDNG